MPAHGAHPVAPAQRGEAVPRLIRFAPALLAECGPAPTRASMPSVAARPRSLCSLRLHFAATRFARSNKGALLPHSAAMLGVLYGALSHSTAHPRATAPLFRFIPPHHGAVGSTASPHNDVQVPCAHGDGMDAGGRATQEQLPDAQERPRFEPTSTPECSLRSPLRLLRPLRIKRFTLRPSGSWSQQSQTPDQARTEERQEGK